MITIDVRLTIDADGELEKVEPMVDGKVLDKEQDKIKFGTITPEEFYGRKKIVSLLGTSSMLIAKSNPTCLYWRVRRTSNGYDYICVEE